MDTHLRPPVILVVEDSPDDFAIFEFALEEANILSTLVHVEDGAEALDYLLGRGEYSDPGKAPVPSVVFLDINLPKVNGIQVLREVRAHKHLAHMPVVMLTVSDSDTDVIGSYDLGSRLFIQKPVVSENLTGIFASLSEFSEPVPTDAL